MIFSKEIFILFSAALLVSTQLTADDQNSPTQVQRSSKSDQAVKPSRDAKPNPSDNLKREVPSRLQGGKHQVMLNPKFQVRSNPAFQVNAPAPQTISPGNPNSSAANNAPAPKAPTQNIQPHRWGGYDYYTPSTGSNGWLNPDDPEYNLEINPDHDLSPNDYDAPNPADHPRRTQPE